jgi:hypothetical protein
MDATRPDVAAPATRGLATPALAMSAALAVSAALAGCGSSGAQGTGTSLAGAVATITEADMRARVGLLAHDSMRGRDTPSPELNEAARYIAAEFRRMGLEPGDDDGDYLQWYPISVRRSRGPARFELIAEEGATAELAYGDDFALHPGFGVPDGETHPLWIAGDDPAAASASAPAGAVWLLNVGAARGAMGPLFEAARAARAAGVAVLVGDAGARFAQRLAQGGPTVQLDTVAADMPFVVFLTGTGAAKLAAATGAAGAMELANGPARTLDARVRVAAHVQIEVTHAPNAIGIVRGGDPRLRDEYVFFTAHMDHVGVGAPVNGDSIYNGADDNASGTSAILEIAEAAATARPRPRRSLAFMTVSGEEKGLFGSQWFSEHPTVPLGRIVANLNVDMVGRNWKDTIAAIGKAQSTLGATADSVARAHPELGLTVVDDLWPEERFYFRSDHYNFARKGIPILFFFNGVHEDYHRPSDEPAKIDAEKAARVARLIFLTGWAVANADGRPQWDPKARAEVVERP